MKKCDHVFPDRVKKCVSDIYESLPKDHSMKQMDFRSHEHWRLLYKCLRVLMSEGVITRERVDGTRFRYGWMCDAPDTTLITYTMNKVKAIAKKANDEYKEIRKAKDLL